MKPVVSSLALASDPPGYIGGSILPRTVVADISWTLLNSIE
jgi:hypothetical protein